MKRRDVPPALCLSRPRERVSSLLTVGGAIVPEQRLMALRRTVHF